MLNIFIKNFTIVLIIIVIILSFAFGRSIAQTYVENSVSELIKTKCEYDLNKFILDKVTNNRIVMLEDAGHGSHIYMQTVINFLNYWAGEIQKNETINLTGSFSSRLYLILESDPVLIDSIYTFFNDGNVYHVLDPNSLPGYQSTTAKFEFYDDLRKVKFRIDSINKNLPEDKKIFFELFGPEKVIDMADWNYEKRDQFYLRGRDEYSSNQIIELLDKDTTAKALIFYGSAHLITYKTRKLETSQEQGYYMAHYLAEHFNHKGGLYIIDQISPVLNPWVNNVYKNSTKNYAMENSIFDGVALPKEMQPLPMDASLILFDKEVKPGQVSQIWSRNLIDCILNNINKFGNLKNDYEKVSINSWLLYLITVSGSKLEDINFNDTAAVNNVIVKFKEWGTSYNKNLADEIINQSIIKNKIQCLDTSQYPFSNRYEFDIINMLDSKIWYSGTSPHIKAELYNKFIQKYAQPIIIENLINLLWVATAEEKARAIEYLKEESGLNYEDAKEWTEWWRGSDYCK